jgi:hypothetical protein
MNPPDVLYVRVGSDSGEYREAHLTRESAQNLVDTWAKKPGVRSGVEYTIVEYVPRECGAEGGKITRAAALRDALGAIPQDICSHDGCDKETTCPLTRVNVAISGLLEKKSGA